MLNPKTIKEHKAKLKLNVDNGSEKTLLTTVPHQTDLPEAVNHNQLIIKQTYLTQRNQQEPIN